MTDFNGFRGNAKRLDDIDLPRIGHRIGVGEDEIHAFMDVEASGSGFDRQGRPKMLFEPHVFYRNLTGTKRRKAVEEGLAYAKWRSRKYPADSYPVLEKAMEIDETAALMAASWGLGQILGENHKALGYPTVQEMVLAFMDDEEEHLKAMVEFIIVNNIDDDLREHRWETVARVYNGPAYKTHNYHGRMAQAYKKWAKIKDTEWDGNLPEPRPDRPVTSGGKRAYTKDEIEGVQKRLRELGYFGTGRVDGILGKHTKGAILVFKSENGLPPNHDIDDALLATLMRAKPREMSPDRENATKDDLKDSPILKETVKAKEKTWWAKILTWLGIGGGVAVGSVDEVIDPSMVSEHMGLLERFAYFFADNWWIFIILIAAILIWWYVSSARENIDSAEDEEVEAHRQGRHM